VTRDEFNAELKLEGGYRVMVRLLREDEGGRKTALSGEGEYRANWTFDSDDPSDQKGAPMLIDADTLAPGAESAASLIRLFPDSWPEVEVGARLTAFEGRRRVAEAVVTHVLRSEP